MQVTNQQSYITYHAIQEMFKEPGMVESHLDPITSSVTQVAQSDFLRQTNAQNFCNFLETPKKKKKKNCRQGSQLNVSNKGFKIVVLHNKLSPAV